MRHLPFEGLTTVRRQGERREERFRIIGTARQDAEAPDCVIFDLVGSGVHPIQAEVEARIVVR